MEENGPTRDLGAENPPRGHESPAGRSRDVQRPGHGVHVAIAEAGRNRLVADMTIAIGDSMSTHIRSVYASLPAQSDESDRRAAHAVRMPLIRWVFALSSHRFGRAFCCRR